MAATAWWARTTTVLDTETTGVGTERDRIVSLAVVRVCGDVARDIAVGVGPRDVDAEAPGRCIVWR